MRIIIAGFAQESNSFSPDVCTLEMFTRLPGGEGTGIIEGHANMPTALAGMIDVINSHGDEIVPVIDLSAQSYGPVDSAVADLFLEKMQNAIRENEPVDAIFLSLHGGMQLTTEEDACGYVLEQVRRMAGNKAVITASTDLHANVTKRFLDNANAITGYQTYPHEDYYETGARAARLGYMALGGEAFSQACIRVPMIVPAESYDTDSGSFAEIIGEAHALKNEGKIIDFSIYMMQPWLNVSDAGSSMLITAKDSETAARYAEYFADKVYSLRKELTIKLYGVDEIIDAAETNQTDAPVILVDSADSPNAGSAADSTEVLRRLKERNTSIKTALCINDIPAVKKAFEIGVGGEAEFTLGGTRDSVFQRPFTVKAYVKSLHDGNYIKEGPTGRGTPQAAGKTAVLKTGPIDIVVFSQMQASSDPQLYRAFGIEPSMYRLVIVKSATQYKTAYRKFTTLFYPADTPGASSANLTALPFDKLPHPFWPFDDVECFDKTVLFARR